MSASTASVRPAVKNLRAMFENKSNDQSTSPPSRSRSSNGSASSQTSRPVSKVRASFVAVERPGEAGQSSQWGLRKTSDVSSMAEVREEAIVDENANDVIGRSAETMSVPAAEHSDLGAILKGSPFESYPTTPVEPVSNIPTAAPTSSMAQPSEQPKPGRTGSSKKVAAMVGNIQSSGQQLPVTEIKPAKSVPVPAALNVKTTTSKPKESPTLTKKSPTLQKKDSPIAINGNGQSIKPKGGVNKIIGVMQSSNKAKEERAKAEQVSSAPVQDSKKNVSKEVKTPTAASKSTSIPKAYAQVKDRQSSGGEQIKSPTSTRPVKLPSAATAGTAASAARKGTSADEETKPASSERKSLIPHAPRVATVSTRASLAKKSSRASLANGDDRPRSRVSAVHKPADDGFLARMTRPTASSARRAQETVQVGSPPKARQQEASKKPARKSLSTNSKPAPTADQANETVLDPVNENSYISGAAGLEQDEGEPGPAEEEGVVESTQPAEVQQTTL